MCFTNDKTPMLILNVVKNSNQIQGHELELFCVTFIIQYTV